MYCSQQARRPPAYALRAAAGQALHGLATPKPEAKAGGKSELRRAVRRVTPGQGDLKDSGTENIPPAKRGRESFWTAVPFVLVPKMTPDPFL